MKGNSQKLEGTHSTIRRWIFMATFFTLGAIITGGLAVLIFSGWIVVVAAIFGGLWGMSIAAFCQVAQ